MVEIAKSAALPYHPPVRPKKAPGLVAISEAAEWADESTRAADSEVDAVWAEVGATAARGGESVASRAAKAVATAAAARKGGLSLEVQRVKAKVETARA